MRRAWVGPVALLLACTSGDEREPVAPAPEPEPAPVTPVAPAIPAAPASSSVLRLHPATTTAELYGLTGDDAGLLLAVGVAGTIVRSDDRGGTWRELAAPTSHKLAAAWRGPTGTLFAVGDVGTIVRSRDRGLTWEVRASGVTADLAHITGNAAEVVAAGAGGTIVRSRDDGETWAPVEMPSLPEKLREAPSRRLREPDEPPPTPSDTDVLRGMFRADEPILGVGAPRPGELFIALRRLVWQRPDERGEWRAVARADDTRESFGELWVGETHWAVTGRNVGRERPRYFVGVGETGASGYVSRWSQVDSRLIGAPEIVGVPRSGQAPGLYLAGDGYAAHWSEDGGSTWDGSEQSALMQSPYPLTKRALWTGSDGVLYAAGTAGVVMRSSDRARTWSVLNGGSREPLFGGALGADGGVFAAVSFAVLRGRGDRWGLLSPASKLPIGGGKEGDTSRGLARCCADVWVAPDGAIVAAGNGLLWRSSDDGRTWAKVHDDEPRWDCCGSLWGDARGVFGVGRDHVLASADAGKTWTRTSLTKVLRPGRRAPRHQRAWRAPAARRRGRGDRAQRRRRAHVGAPRRADEAAAARRAHHARQGRRPAVPRGRRAGHRAALDRRDDLGGDRRPDDGAPARRARRLQSHRVLYRGRAGAAALARRRAHLDARPRGRGAAA